MLSKSIAGSCMRRPGRKDMCAGWRRTAAGPILGGWGTRWRSTRSPSTTASSMVARSRARSVSLQPHGRTWQTCPGCCAGTQAAAARAATGRAPEPGSAAWTSVRRFLDPAGYEFKDSNEWARVTSLTTFQGKQFASMGSCTSSRLDAPCDFRGQVYAMEAGRCASYDRDLGPGWHHLTAVRRGDRLELFVDGQLAATSSTFDPAAYDLTSTARCGSVLAKSTTFRARSAKCGCTTAPGSTGNQGLGRGVR